MRVDLHPRTKGIANTKKPSTQTNVQQGVDLVKMGVIPHLIAPTSLPHGACASRSASPVSKLAVAPASVMRRCSCDSPVNCDGGRKEMACQPSVERLERLGRATTVAPLSRRLKWGRALRRLLLLKDPSCLKMGCVGSATECMYLHSAAPWLHPVCGRRSCAGRSSREAA